MRIFFIAKIWILILSIFLWGVFQVLAAWISSKLSSKCFTTDSFLFKERKWEKGGKIYSNIFKVKKWKKYLPDGAAVIKDAYEKKNLRDYSKENLEVFVEESCRAELTHILAIIPFWVFGFFGPSEIIVYMLIYSLAINMPCIIVQRFNRPRIKKILKMI